MSSTHLESLGLGEGGVSVCQGLHQLSLQLSTHSLHLLPGTSLRHPLQGVVSLGLGEEREGGISMLQVFRSKDDLEFEQWYIASRPGYIMLA